MSKVVECSVIIKDDFNNIFIVQRKTKKNQPKYWYIVGKKIKGRESEEKCISRAIKDDLKSIVFNLEKVGEIDNKNLEGLSALYIGELKEKIVLGNDIEEGKWIKISDIDNYEFEINEVEKIKLFKETIAN